MSLKDPSAIFSTIKNHQNLTIFLLISIFALHELFFLITYNINFPHAEDFWHIVYIYKYIITGNLSYNDFISSFNGHIPLFPKLITFPYFYFNSFEIGNLYYLQWVIMSLSLYFIYLLLKKTNKTLFWTLVPISAFVFSPLLTHGYYIIGTLQWQIPSLCTIILTYLFTKNINFKIFVAAISLAILSTFTLIIGVVTWLPPLVWLIFKFTKTRSRNTGKWLIIWIVVMITTGLVYYSLVPHTEIEIKLQSLFTSTGIEYIAAFLASPFRLKYEFLLISVGILTLFLSIFFAYYYIGKKRKIEFTLPWLIFLLIGIISSFITVLGRTNLLLNFAYRPDYILYSYLTQFGLLILTATTIQELAQSSDKYKKIKILFLIIIIIAQITMLAPSYYAGWIRGEHYFQQKLEYAECFSLTHGSECLDTLYGGLSSEVETIMLYDMLNYWLKNKFSIFGETNFNQQNIKDIQKFEQIWNNEKEISFSFGQIETVNGIDISEKESITIEKPVIIITGWALDHEKKQLDSIYLIIDDKPFLKYNNFEHRNDITNKLDLNHNLQLGWKISFLAGYLIEGCHKMTIAGLKNDNMVLLNQVVEICKT